VKVFAAAMLATSERCDGRREGGGKGGGEKVKLEVRRWLQGGGGGIDRRSCEGRWKWVSPKI
jgi:hypothetical protein